MACLLWSLLLVNPAGPFCCTEATLPEPNSLQAGTLTHSTLDHQLQLPTSRLLFSPLTPLKLLLLLLLLPFISRAFPHPRSPSHPAHCVVVVLLWCFPSGTYLVDLHTLLIPSTYIHLLSTCGLACNSLLAHFHLPACAPCSACLPTSASRRFYSIDSSSILIHQVSESAALSSRPRPSVVLYSLTHSFITSTSFPILLLPLPFTPHLLLAALSSSFSALLLLGLVPLSVLRKSLNVIFITTHTL